MGGHRPTVAARVLVLVVLRLKQHLPNWIMARPKNANSNFLKKEAYISITDYYANLVLTVSCE